MEELERSLALANMDVKAVRESLEKLSHLPVGPGGIIDDDTLSKHIAESLLNHSTHNNMEPSADICKGLTDDLTQESINAIARSLSTPEMPAVAAVTTASIVNGPVYNRQHSTVQSRSHV